MNASTSGLLRLSYTDLLQLTSDLAAANSETDLVEKAKQGILQALDPMAVFVAFPDPNRPSRFVLHTDSKFERTNQEQVIDFLQSLLLSGIDSISVELVHSLPFLEGMSIFLVKSAAIHADRVLLLVLGTNEGTPELVRSFLQFMEQLLQVHLENLRLKRAEEHRRDSFAGLHRTAEEMSRRLFYVDDVLQGIIREACHVLHTGAAAVLIPADETKTEYSIRAQWGFPSETIPLSSALFAKAFDDFDLNDRKVAVYHAGTNETYLLVPLIQRGQANGALFLCSNQSDFEVTEEDMGVAEIFGYWVSIAMENAIVFRRVSRSQREWENTFDSIADPIYIIDNDYRLKKINKSLAALTMKSIKLPLDRHCYRYLFQQSAICPWCPVPKSMETKKPASVEASLFSGEPWQIQAFPYTDDSENQSGWINILRDMSLLKRVQEQLIESEKLASIGKLISGVAHEVRNPLFGISTTVRALANELGDREAIKPFLEIITSETGRLNRLMEDLLHFSRPVRIDKNPSDLAEIVKETIEQFKTVSSAQGVEIHLLDSERVPPMNVDRNGIKQVLLNLFENGVQHAREDLRIDVFLEYLSLADPPEIQLVIKDNGAGITPEVLPRVFDPFFTTRPRGTGLGLSIVRKVIHYHGGRIAVESHSGVGTTFRITLPVTSTPS